MTATAPLATPARDAEDRRDERQLRARSAPGSWSCWRRLAVTVLTSGPTAAAAGDDRAAGAGSRWACGWRRSCSACWRRLRPSVVLQEKKKQPASLVFLIDDSSSMKINDEVRRPDPLGPGAEDAGAGARGRRRRSGRRPGRQVLPLRHGAPRRHRRRHEPSPTAGRRRSGTALLEAVQRQAGTRVAAVVVLLRRREQRRARPRWSPPAGCGASRSRSSPSASAPRTPAPARRTSPSATSSPARPSSSRTSSRSGGRSSSAGSRTSRSTSRCSSRGTTSRSPTQRIKVPEGTEVVPITGLKYIPQTPGREEDHAQGQAEGGGAGPDEQRDQHVRHRPEGRPERPLRPGAALLLGVEVSGCASSPRRPTSRPTSRSSASPAAGRAASSSDDDFAPGRYDVYILGDLPADFLTPGPAAACWPTRSRRGPGLIMLGRPFELRRRAAGRAPSWPASCPSTSTPATARSSPRGA